MIGGFRSAWGGLGRRWGCLYTHSDGWQPQRWCRPRLAVAAFRDAQPDSALLNAGVRAATLRRTSTALGGEAVLFCIVVAIRRRMMQLRTHAVLFCTRAPRQFEPSGAATSA
jgi:hypothetical protein